jgi:GTP-binding protein HflX
VIVGDAHQLFIPDLTRARAGSGRFRGLRLVHTHLRGEGLSRDDMTDLTLLRLDAIVVVQALDSGLPGPIELGHLVPEFREQQEPWSIEPISSVHGWDSDYLEFIADLETRFSKKRKAQKVDGREGCILVSAATRSPAMARASLDELGRLADTAGLQVLDQVLQMRRKLDHRFVVGRGKLDDVQIRAMQLDAKVLVFDQELTPAQLRNIATATEFKVVDRTQLILDIFALRASTREGKLQVELAQLRYRKPRLALMPTAMSRLTGGIGGRGPGETKLEINRRRADERQTRLEKQLRGLSKQRGLRRSRRKKVGLPQVAIVGYTNAGKSTLLNRMTRSDVDAEDKLFATLDPTSRRLRFPREREIILTDTVGFIRDLPKDLVEAFRSTLEEVIEADLILHVVDGASPELSMHMDEVLETLGRLDALDIPRLTVLNKMDAIEATAWPELPQSTQAMRVSARTGEGLQAIMEELERRLFRQRASSRTETSP